MQFSFVELSANSPDMSNQTGQLAIRRPPFGKVQFYYNTNSDLRVVEFHGAR